MKKILIVTLLVAFSSSVYASSCPMMTKKIDDKIEQVQKLRDEAVKAHESGNHAKADELFEKAMELFKS
tara:strand:+ start:2089 stop:2295 length:207 start_codon:yes stop_codon:yes gene_type:complete